MLSRGKLLVQLAQQNNSLACDENHDSGEDNPMLVTESSDNNPSEEDSHTILDDLTDDDRDQDYIPSDSADSNETDSINQIDHEEIVESSPTKKRKRVNKRSKNKRLRMQGKQYLGLKKTEKGNFDQCMLKSERLLCPRNCTRRCEKGWGGRKCNSIDDTTREDIFRLFWETMTWGEKKVYVISLVEKKEVERKTAEAASRRKFSYQFFLKKNTSKIKVCQSLFLSTLGLRNETVYRWIGEGNEDHGIPKSPTAGQTSNNAKKEEAKAGAEQYLRNVPKMPSHYCRAQSSKLYLETTHHTLRELYIDYKSRMERSSIPVYGISQFTRLYNDMNLAIFKPKKDMCDACCAFKSGTLNEENYNQHIKRKEAAAQAKALDKETATVHGKQKVITMDLQSLLLCPKLEASCLFYKTKLCCHNFTMFDLVTREAMCYFWNETAADLNASTFVTCIIDYLEKISLEGLDRIIIYSDGCTYQNRNVTLANALLQFAVRNKIELEQKYLEKGHTYMECDSIHASIQRFIKNRDIFVPQQYIEARKGARKTPYNVKYVDFTFFKDFSICLFIQV